MVLFDPTVILSTVTTQNQAISGALSVPYPCTRPDVPYWHLDRSGAEGEFCYATEDRSYRFYSMGYNLPPALDYTLIYHPDPYHDEGMFCLGSGTVNSRGAIYIKGRVRREKMPKLEDQIYPGGARVWLVLSMDVDCGSARMTNWHPATYLFEHDLLDMHATGRYGKIQYIH